MVTRFFIWLGKTAATVLLTVVLTLWLTGLITTSVVQSVLDEYDIPLNVEPVIYSGVLSFLWGFDDSRQEDRATLLEETHIDDEANNPALPTSEQEEALGEQEPVVEVLAPVELGEETEISRNDLEETKEGLTDEERERVLQIIVEKLPADQWQIISLYMEDGLSETELLDTQQILAQYLSDEEYSELLSILKKS